MLIAPAYTFLLANQPVDYQFWMDVGSPAWSERLYQPLTHPIILSRGWPERTCLDGCGRIRIQPRYALPAGAWACCAAAANRFILGLCELGESGYEIARDAAARDSNGAAAVEGVQPMTCRTADDSRPDGLRPTQREY